MKIHLSEQAKGIHVGEVWPSSLQQPITVTIIESLGHFVPYVEGELISDSCRTLEEAAVLLTDVVERRYGSLQIIAQAERDHMLFADERSSRSTTARTISQRIDDRRARQIPLPSYRTQPSSLHSPAHAPKKRDVVGPALGGAVAASVAVIVALFAGGLISVKPPSNASEQITIASIFDYELSVHAFDFQFPGLGQTGREPAVASANMDSATEELPGTQQQLSAVGAVVPSSTVISSVVRTVSAPTSSVVRTVSAPTSSVVRTVEGLVKPLLLRGNVQRIVLSRQFLLLSRQPHFRPPQRPQLLRFLKIKNPRKLKNRINSKYPAGKIFSELIIRVC